MRAVLIAVASGLVGGIGFASIMAAAAFLTPDDYQPHEGELRIPPDWLLWRGFDWIFNATLFGGLGVGIWLELYALIVPTSMILGMTAFTRFWMPHVPKPEWMDENVPVVSGDAV